MNFCAQYYRAPFPDREYWESDIIRMKESGLNAFQIWVAWGWVEATPGVFDYSDYDEVVALAAKHGMNVIVSTIAEVQPNWIHREIPGCELVDNEGLKKPSGTRTEHHFGVTPGGCFDHPEVHRRMFRFLEETAAHYGKTPNVIGWDIWNEVRWDEQTDAFCCFCEHTKAAFRAWLQRKYDTLDALNQAWRRRYAAWEDVQPGTDPGRPCTELVQFAEFLTWRGNNHARERAECIRRHAGSGQVISIHGNAPCANYVGGPTMAPLNRGTDFGYTDCTDGVGCSSFPLWMRMGLTDFAVRLDMTRSAVARKPNARFWLSELQGGTISISFNTPTETLCYDVLGPYIQEAWLWTGISAGASAIIFWCWRNEVFGRESSGCGMIGNDGAADARIAALRENTDIFRRHAALLDDFQPAPAEVGVFFSTGSYYAAWANEPKTARVVYEAMRGYARALTRRNIPYRLVESEHLEDLSGLKLLIVPRAIVLERRHEEALESFARNGGTVVMESETGAFDSCDLFRYPEKRLTARLGLEEAGRRPLPPAGKRAFRAAVGDRSFTLNSTQWLTPFAADGSVYREVKCGKGTVIGVGTYPENDYFENGTAAFEEWVEALADAAGVTRLFVNRDINAQADKKADCPLLRWGTSADGAQTVLFAVLPESQPSVRVEIAQALRGCTAQELVSGKAVDLSSGDVTLTADVARNVPVRILVVS